MVVGPRRAQDTSPAIRTRWIGSRGGQPLRRRGPVPAARHPAAGRSCVPSYQVTGEEEHSTRGRARLLFEMLDGHGDSPVANGWRSTAVRDALDLCLGLQGLQNETVRPNVDMATYKAEFLAHHYHNRRASPGLALRPGLAARVARRLGGVAGPSAVNAVGSAPAAAATGHAAAAGSRPATFRCLRQQTFRRWLGPSEAALRVRGGTVVLWPDTFTNHFHPHIGAGRRTRCWTDAGWNRSSLPDPAAGAAGSPGSPPASWRHAEEGA